MSTNHHDPIASNAPAAAATFNDPLGQLDQAITNIGETAVNDLSDVTIDGTPADNELIAYDTATSEFINQTAAEAGLSAVGHTHTVSDVTDLDLATVPYTPDTLADWDDAADPGSAADGLDQIAARLRAAEATYGGNHVYNTPSIELADGVQPEWWEVSNGTLTEEDAAGESIPEKHKRVLKLVTSATDGYAYQQYDQSAEPLLDDSVTVVSAGVWVYNQTAGTVTLELYDVGGTASLGTATTTATNAWTYVKLEGVTVGTTTLELRFKHSANAATLYLAMPLLNVGQRVMPWRPRGLRYIDREAGTDSLNAVDPADTDWHDLDVSGVTTPLTAVIECNVFIQSTAAGHFMQIRRNGETTTGNGTVLARTQAVSQYVIAPGKCQCDDLQIIEWKASNAAISGLILNVYAFWEWE